MRYCNYKPAPAFCTFWIELNDNENSPDLFATLFDDMVMEGLHDTN